LDTENELALLLDGISHSPVFVSIYANDQDCLLICWILSRHLQPWILFFLLIIYMVLSSNHQYVLIFR